MPRIFIADDHPITLEGLTLILSSQPDFQVVGTAVTGEEAANSIIELQPDIAVLDLSFRDTDGLAIGRQLSTECRGTRLLALTQSETSSTLREALACGFSGYVVKRSASRHLIDAIHGIMVGGLYIDPVMASHLYHPPQRRRRVLTSPELTQRECDVLRGIAIGMTAKAIGQHHDISVSSVETYKSRACAKLGIASREGIVRFAAGRGWLNSVQLT